MAKLTAIAQQLPPSVRKIAAVSGSAADFARINKGVFDEVVEMPSPYAVLTLKDRFDAVLSVMDPWAALLGARRRVPVGYVDSLFWFWDWENVNFPNLRSLSEEWVSATSAELESWTSQTLNWHEITPMAYHWSTRVYPQRAPRIEERSGLYPSGRIEPVGAVIAIRPHLAMSDKPVVSLSGALSHLTPRTTAQRYARVVRAMLESSHIDKAIITGNPAVLEEFADGPWDVRPSTFSEMHAMIAQAPYLIAPAGLTTILEAAAVQTPIILLPEQHGGHASNVDLVKSADPGAYDDVLLRRWFDMSSADATTAIQEIDKIYTTLLHDPHPFEFHRMTEHFRAAVSRLSTAKDRRAMALRQYDTVAGLVGDFNGARDVANSFLNLIASDRID